MSEEYNYTVDIVSLKKIMVEYGLDKISELAKATGISRNTLGKVIKGKALPSIKVMFALSDALHLTPSKAGNIFFHTNLRNT